jgi:chromosome partitioning protein
MARILAVANQKGGCGKTSLAVNLAAALAQRNEHVLLVDFDPQGHASLGLGVDGGRLEKSMYNVLTEAPDERAALDDVVQHAGAALDLAPASVALCALEQELAGRNGRELRLKRALKAVEHVYDFIIIDCPPSLGLLTFNALIAANELIIPLECSSYALQGAARLLDTVALIRHELEHDLEHYIVFSMVDRATRFSRAMMRTTLDAYPGRVLHTRIEYTVRIKESAARGRPVTHSRSRRSRAWRNFYSLACEIQSLKRLAEIHCMRLDFSASKFPLQLHSGVCFALQNEQARDVYVLGDFNNWKAGEESRLLPDGFGGWRKFVPLLPGVSYQYKYCVDGAWVDDQNNPCREPSPYGGYNSVIALETSLPA